jgi:hypothetical protein
VAHAGELELLKQQGLATENHLTAQIATLTKAVWEGKPSPEFVDKDT